MPSRSKVMNSNVGKRAIDQGMAVFHPSYESIALAAKKATNLTRFMAMINSKFFLERAATDSAAGILRFQYLIVPRRGETISASYVALPSLLGGFGCVSFSTFLLESLIVSLVVCGLKRLAKINGEPG